MKNKNKSWVMSVVLVVFSLVTYAQTPTTNLTNHQPTAALPVGTTFEWHVGATSSSAIVSTPSAVSPGLYYGFYNYGSACFSEAAPIRVITNTCPTTTVDLNTAVNTPPLGSTLSFHSGAIASDANQITGIAITAAGTGTYYVAYKTTVNSANCYSATSPIVVVITICCPVLTNSGTSTDNINPTTCGGSDGSIKICGLVANSTGNTINYDKNGTAAIALTNQTADASGCLIITGLPAGTYTNIKVTNANCPSGSNTVSATLTDALIPVAPSLARATPTSVCSGLTSTLSGTCSIGTLTWFTDAALTSAVGGSMVNPASTTTYYGSCVSGTCKSPSVSVSVTVTPCANPDTSPAVAGVLKNIPILTNDKNPDGTPVTDLTKITTPTITANPSKGAVTVKADGSVDYTPNPGTSGTDTFIYSICDKANPSVCDTAKVTVTIAPAPQANPDASPAIAGVLKNIPILTNDKNPDGTPVTDFTKITTPTIATAPTKGTVTVKADGSVDYTPNPGTSGTDTFIYSICDKFNPTICDTAKVTVTITPAPQANPDPSPAVAGILKNIPILANDKNPDGTPVTDLTKITTPTIATAPTKGTVTVKADGSVDYTPNPGTTGTDTFIYSICDKTNPTVCDTAKVTVTITPAPQANPDTSPAVAGILKNIPILANDKNPDGTPVTDLTKITTPTIATAPTKGTVTVKADGSVDYTPNPGTSGTDTFIYSICDKTNPSVCDTAKVTVTITPAPVANPDTITATAGVLKNIPILTNDKNPDGTPVTDLTKITTPTITANPTKGTVTVKADGSVDYTPNPGTSGTDTFVYTICDQTNPTVCDTAKVTVTITPAPAANPDQPTATAGLPTTIPVLANDKNPDGTPADLTKVTLPTVTTSGADAPTKGTATVNPDGTITYTPNPGTSGTDTFVYTICDKANPSVCDTAKVTVTITPAPQANPDASPAIAGVLKNIPILTNDKNPDGTPVTDLTKITTPTIIANPTKGTVTVKADGSVDYTPNPGTSGTDTFIYTICDKLNPSVCDTAKVTVTITPAPAANPDQPTAVAGVLKNIPILGNDKNPDGTPVTDLTKITTPTITANPSKGTVTVKADGSVDYTPNPGTSGTDTFVYTICDKTNPSVCDTAKVTVTITPAPQANPDASPAVAGILKNIPILTNDKNPDGTPVTDLTKITTPTITTNPTKGTVTVKADGSVDYTPNPGTSGTDTFIYTICDKLNPSVCDTAKVTVTITPAPAANPDQPTATAGLPTTIPVLANDKNPDGTPADLTKVTLPTVTTSGADAPTKGTATVNPDGTIKYTPNPGTSGTDTFVYSICDKTNPTVCDTAKVTVTITPAPQANPDASPAIAGILKNIPILTNDKNPDGTPVTDLTKITTPTIATAPTKGTVTVKADGSVDYTPNSGTSGTDTFVYSICDKTNPSVCDTAKVTVTITPAPVANPDTITATAGVLKNIPILTNDKNPDGTPVIDLTKITTPIIATAPTKGIAVVKADGSIDYTPNSGTSGTDTFIYTICDIANSSVCDTAKVTLTIEVPPINKVCLLPKAYLQGALLGVLLPNTLMRDDLRVKGLIPTSSPYTNGITTTGVIASSVLSVTGADAIVDWVFVELRSGLDSTVIVDSRSALIQRDGDIVDVDGVGSVKFTEANAGQYYVVVKHRNHLGVMSFKTQMDNTCAIIDFRNVSTPNYNFNVNNAINLPQVDVQQGKALWAGNVLYDNNVIFQGTGNDVNVIYQQVINASGNFFVSPSYILKGYYSGDIDLNGATIFQGTGNDIEFIYKNVIKNHPGNIFKLNSFKIKAQIP